MLTVVQVTCLKTRGNTCAILHKAGKVLQYEAVAGFEPSANGVGTAHSVAITQRLIDKGGYLADWTRKLLSLYGDAVELHPNNTQHLHFAGY